MRIITTGSRDWPDDVMSHTIIRSTMYGLWHANSYSTEKLTVVHGACPTGADKIVDDWATDMEGWAEKNSSPLPGVQVVVERHPADWEKYGKAAGPIRNKVIADRGGHLCVAFLYEPEGKRSKGTRDMITEARNKGIGIVEVPWRR